MHVTVLHPYITFSCELLDGFFIFQYLLSYFIVFSYTMADSTSHVKHRLSSLANKWVRYRLNINFIQCSLTCKFVPKGFRLHLLPPVPPNSSTRKGICHSWHRQLELCSMSLMKLTCAFYATELPSLIDTILDLSSHVSYDFLLHLQNKLLFLHNQILSIHCQKVQELQSFLQRSSVYFSFCDERSFTYG